MKFDVVYNDNEGDIEIFNAENGLNLFVLSVQDEDDAHHLMDFVEYLGHEVRNYDFVSAEDETKEEFILDEAEYLEVENED